jgi:hypothetical protein
MSAPNTPNTDFQPLSFDEAIQYYWTGPNDPTVTEYRLTLNYDGGSYVYTIPAPQVTYLATGLTNGVTYSATLEARNTTDYSIPGTYRDWQCGAAPSIPVTATATLVGSNGASISWSAGTPVNAQVQWYVIDMYSTSNSVPLASYSANGLTQSNFFIGGLSTNAVYYFNVSAVNCPDYSVPKRTSTIQYLFPFVPTMLSGLSMWLDGRDPSNTGSAPANGTPITTWVDKSGQGYNGTSAGTTPTYSSTDQTLNMSLNSRFTTTYSASLSNESIFAVFKLTNASQTHIIGASATGGRTVYTYNTNNLLEAGPTGVGTGTYTANNSTSLNNILLGSVTITNNLWASWVNGGNTSYSGTIANTAGRTTNIGSSGATINYIYEVNIYNQSLTPYNRQKVEGYLAWKWGIQSNLPTSHPFRAAAPLSNSVFTPTSFSNIQIWYDGADPLGTGAAPANGTSIATWADKSGRNNNATAVVAASYVVNTSNGNYLNFNGTSTYYNITSGAFIVNQYNTIFIVERLQLNSGGFMTLVSGSTPSAPNNLLIRYVGTEQNQYTYYGAGQLAVSGLSYSGATQPSRIWSYSQNPSSGAMFLNGTSCNTNTNNTLLASWATPTIGRDADAGGRFYGGEIREMIFYTGVMSTGDRQTVEGYLAWKWGLQSNLPGTHPYYDNNPGALAPTIFTPSNFTGLNIWLDASDAATFTYSGANILTWADKSGSTNTLGYNTGSYAIRTTDAGKTVVQFPNATAQYNSLLTTAYTNNVIIFFVMKKTDTSYWQAMNVAGITPIYDYDYGGGPGLLYGGPSPAGQGGNGYYLVNGSRNTVNSGTYTTYFIARGTGSGATTNVRVGPVFGSVCEVIVYNRSAALSEAQAQQVEGYLAWKWGLQNLLPYTHAYKFVNPGAATTNAIVSSGLLIEFDANVLDPTNWGGNSTRFWPNTGSLGQTQNATPTGSVSKNAAGNGVVLAGSSFYSFPNIAVGNAWTVSMWIKRTGTPTGTPAYITQQWTSLPNPINFMISANNQGASSTQCIGSFFFNSAWRNGTVVDLPLNTWRQVVCSWNGSALATYVNGTLAGSEPIAGVTSQDGGLQYYIGRRWDNNEYIIAEIGQVLVYNRAITATEVAQNYSVTNSIFSV